MKTSAYYSQKIRSCGLRSTSARVATLKALAGARQPLSVEDLRSRVRGDLATVYRNVNAFAEAGLVSVMELGTGRKFVELCDSPPAHRHHVICESCHKIEAVDACGIEAHMRLLEKMGYRRLRHRLEFSGVCRACL